MKPDRELLLLHRLMANQPAALLSCLQHYSEGGRLPAEVARADGETLRQVDQELEWLAAPNRHLVMFTDDSYPASLAATSDPPPMLFADGELDCLNASQHIAMVGSRKATMNGARVAHDMAAELAAAGFVVVSGLALGIDSRAHEGALSVDHGRTIAVLGTGCDVVYPRRNWRLADRIRNSGLLLSEFPLGTPAFPANFPRRNRIVTGLSAATLVVEASLGSGSLISASLAISQGRDVMAMPGNPNHSQSRGCHQLIRDGAALIENAADVLRELGLDAPNAPVMPSRPRLTPAQHALLDCLDAGPLSLDMLCEVSRLPPETITVGLMSLEIAGLVTSDAGFYVRQPSG